MEKSNITEMRMDENDSFFKLKEQLEDAQKLMGRMEQYIVEAKVLQSQYPAAVRIPICLFGRYDSGDCENFRTFDR